jgi:hypothetical protein
MATAANERRSEKTPAEGLKKKEVPTVRSCNTTADQSGECVAFRTTTYWTLSSAATKEVQGPSTGLGDSRVCQP